MEYSIIATVKFIDTDSAYYNHEEYNGNSELLEIFKERWSNLPKVCNWFSVTFKEYDHKEWNDKFYTYYPAMDVYIESVPVSFDEIHSVINFIDALKNMFNGNDFTYEIRCI